MTEPGNFHRVHLSPNPRRSSKALFVDRDGTIIAQVNYLADPAKVEMYPGVPAALARFQAAGYALVMVSNQAGIGLGLLDWNQFDAVADRVRELLAEGGVVFDAELVCGHDSDDPPCGWRKPEPGMFLEAIRELDLDVANSAVAGDRLSDLEAGAAAGVTRFFHVGTGHGEHDRPAVVAWGRGVTELDSLADLRP